MEIWRQELNLILLCGCQALPSTCPQLLCPPLHPLLPYPAHTVFEAASAAVSCGGWGTRARRSCRHLNRGLNPEAKYPPWSQFSPVESYLCAGVHLASPWPKSLPHSVAPVLCVLRCQLALDRRQVTCWSRQRGMDVNGGKCRLSCWIWVPPCHHRATCDVHVQAGNLCFPQV